MAKLGPIEKRTKSGDKLTIRVPELSEAQNILDFARTVMGETDFLLTQPDEMRNTEEEEQKWIQGKIDRPTSIVLIGCVAGQIVSMIDFTAGGRRRNAHHGSLGVSVLKKYWGEGIGRAMMETLIEWARATGIIEKVCLEVVATNERAIKLYRNLGFIEEGRLIKDMKYGDGHYADGILMAKFLRSS